MQVQMYVLDIVGHCTSTSDWWSCCWSAVHYGNIHIIVLGYSVITYWLFLSLLVYWRHRANVPSSRSGKWINKMIFPGWHHWFE